MRLSLISQLLLVFASVLSLTQASFYPFGSAAGDTNNPVSDDGSSPEIQLLSSFVFFGQTYQKIYVNNNGYLTFDKSLDLTSPSSISSVGNPDVIAGLWTDFNNINGVISYNQYTAENILIRATQDINTYFPNLNSAASWVFVATWDTVSYFSPGVASFQMVLISSGYYSFILMNYGDVSATGDPVAAGYYTTNSLNFVIPGSDSGSSIPNLKTSSNVGVSGRWVFRVDGRPTLNISVSSLSAEGTNTSTTTVSNSNSLVVNASATTTLTGTNTSNTTVSNLSAEGTNTSNTTVSNINVVLNASATTTLTGTNTSTTTVSNLSSEAIAQTASTPTKPAVTNTSTSTVSTILVNAEAIAQAGSAPTSATTTTAVTTQTTPSTTSALTISPLTTSAPATQPAKTIFYPNTNDPVQNGCFLVTLSSRFTVCGRTYQQINVSIQIHSDISSSMSYQQYTSGNILSLATQDINKYIPKLTFTASWVLVATWNKANTETSFQVVLVSDRYYSFILVNSGTVTGDPVMADCDTINSLTCFGIPGSYSRSFFSNLKNSSNVDVPGRWVFRVDGTTTSTTIVSTASTVSPGWQSSSFMLFLYLYTLSFFLY